MKLVKCKICGKEYKNLRILHHSINESKGSKCGMKLKTLLHEIKKEEMFDEV